MPALLVALIALVLTIPAEATPRKNHHRVRVPVVIEGVGHLTFCVAPRRRR